MSEIFEKLNENSDRLDYLIIECALQVKNSGICCYLSVVGIISREIGKHGRYVNFSVDYGSMTFI